MPYKVSTPFRKSLVRGAKTLGRKSFNTWVTTMSIWSNTKVKVTKEFQQIPKIFIMGEYDNIFIQMFRKHINKHKNFAYKIIEKCGHVCNLEQPQVFNKLALEFMGN